LATQKFHHNELSLKWHLYISASFLQSRLYPGTPSFVSTTNVYFSMKNNLTNCVIAVLLLLSVGATAQTIKAVDNSLNAGKVEWVARQINAGKVPFGVPVTREFEVKNISTESLLILQVKSSCHCTMVEWSKESVEPGKSSIIKVTYDALKEGDFYRIVTVHTNFDTNQSVPLAINGKVEPPVSASKQ
jgi:hypothetical protein